MEHSGIFGESELIQILLNKIADILDMWSLIEYAYESLTPEQKARTEIEAGPLENPKFRGFDGNNESEYMAVKNGS